MARTSTYTQFIALPPETLWQVVGNPGHWSRWNPAVTSAVLDGPVAVGAGGRYMPRGPVAERVHRWTSTPFRITEVTPGRSLTLEQPEPPSGVMRVTWMLEPHGTGTLVTQALTFTGVAGPAARAVAGARLEADGRVMFARLALAAGITPDADALAVVIAGGSGALGRNLAADLVCRGLGVTVLTRRHDPKLPFAQVEWDGRTVGDWARALDDPTETAIVNLAGRIVDCRPTPRNIARLRDSRVESTRALVTAVAAQPEPVARWIQASTTAIWSDAGELRCTETTPLPEGLPQMTGVARPWEEAFDGAKADHSTILRTSIVLDRHAPALRRLVQLTKAGLGGRVGSGAQWFSWIHIEDWLAIVRAALGLDPDITLPNGILVAATDSPVRNHELMSTLRHHLHRPPAPPTPTLALTLGAILLRTDPALALTGRHTTSPALRDAGFTFRYPTLPEALTDLIPR
ncbi:DUF1731 domain-containing protein [Nocardia bovistercoris]|uniref:DUF1731 domain-containing protein n=1 Tax=Nocardia bovistercoris TaxID=2785916 RepID=A0A931I760_9NOCA|nr:DUF1731 domain-containing protein [Nocardia bovistercoris]MBH0776187.1 DUF1731 domain-containing protein [Nocardia bovistercoris]